MLDISQLFCSLSLVSGSYGTAVLYRKKDDDSLVILKEINIHDLNATERQMAKNEVKTQFICILALFLAVYVHC